MTLNIDDDIAVFVMALPSLYLVLSLVAGTMRAALVWLILGLGVYLSRVRVAAFVGSSQATTGS